MADILQQWRKVREQYARKKANFKQLLFEYILLRQTYVFHQAFYAAIIKGIPSTFDLDQCSVEQLQTLHQALEHDSKAGQATWKIYETQTKMHETYDAVERYIAFREEYFILEQSEQDRLDEVKIAIAAGRQETVEFGSRLVKAR